ncbi:sel1 repeat family protein [Oceanicella actignis]|uniref:Sel1 repeat-containing protein n=1 Tax=Oceanicella actignis TaxID=1189325 RepID=A0A1M7TNQ0_9RHOB|nr:sel1 repeat family protein [Oceanicella actignis]TYO85223.1 hypothetical protein LY05_02649 [Oceanicella actignis]SET73022.1 hypothetical protein SAMN04488119_10877 [Oceanicella actignis]SHN72374.1 hypothetical protein SAMN05216200_10878 [Oceanicella actignis]
MPVRHPSPPILRAALLAVAGALIGQTAALPARADAGAPAPDEGGVLNPDEMTMRRFVERARRGEADMVLCAQGYLATKSGRHEWARTLFQSCAEAGWTGAMTWMGQLEDNGLGGPEDPAAAARWDRRAAEAGDPVGKFNYGLDLLRGRGVPRDEAQGRALVDAAAREGVEAARRLRAAGYDLDEVTPDADDWKYRPMF